jgi:hypothetical protein
VLASFGNTQRTEQVDRIDADAFCFDGDAFSGVYLGGQQCDWRSASFGGRSEAKGLYASSRRHTVPFLFDSFSFIN